MLKIGDYARTINGIIGKLIKEQPFMNDILVFLDNGQGNISYQNKDGVFKVNHKEDIIKSSPNIIDLIEVGDYVNKEEVLEVIIDRNMSRVKTIDGTYFNEDIKSIVTKEKYESMEYRIGE